MLPKTSPTLFETLATSGLYPRATSVGKVISEPEPTIALTIPASPPAAKTARAPSQVKWCTSAPSICHADASGVARRPTASCEDVTKSSVQTNFLQLRPSLGTSGEG